MRAEMDLHTFNNPDVICTVIDALKMARKCEYISYLMIYIIKQYIENWLKY